MTTTTSTGTFPKPTIRAVLIDLSGTLHVGDQAIPGTHSALERLRQHHHGLAIKFVSNTSKQSTHQLLQILNGTLDFKIRRDELVTSVMATAAYVRRRNLQRPLCLMEDVSDLDLEGVDCKRPVNDDDNDDDTTAMDSSYDSVIVGLAPSQFHYDRLNQAFRVLLRHPDGLIAVHRANYYKESMSMTNGKVSEEQRLSLGPGAFVTALETASGCRPATVVGKPNPAFFQSALCEGISLEETCMIGDDVLGDCQGALHAGIGTAILVQTGKYRPGDEDKLEQYVSKEGSGGSSFLVVASIVEAVDYILGSNME